MLCAMPTDDRRPEIEYPCPWSYRIVCSDEAAVRAAVPGIVGGETHTLVMVRESRAARYRTLELELVVRDQAHRDTVFQALQRIAGVRMLL
jgi:putative lipoic acid-binding regulatory protein